MPILPLILAVNLAAPTPELALAPDPALAHDLAVDGAVLAELNRARTSAAAFAASLAEQRGFYHGMLLVHPGQETFETEEGIAPVDEAIAFVKDRAAGAALLSAPVLAAAAADHQAEQQETGEVGHAGPDGSTPSDRVAAAMPMWASSSPMAPPIPPTSSASWWSTTASPIAATAG